MAFVFHVIAIEYAALHAACSRADPAALTARVHMVAAFREKPHIIIKIQRLVTSAVLILAPWLWLRLDEMSTRCLANTTRMLLTSHQPHSATM